MSTEVVKKEASPSERFTALVLREATSLSGEVAMSDFQKRLSNNYFVKLDSVLKEAEKKRLAKSEAYRDKVEISWKTVNMEKLALDVVAFSAIGLDPIQKNHVSLIPYKNNSSGKYDINFMIGYRGMELKAMKYGFNIPDEVIVKVVYANETFTPIYKDIENKIETYIFKPSPDAFDRGEIKGGFYYHGYKNNPEANKLRVLSLADIEKRIPSHASVEFWGGEKDEYVNGKKTGKKVQTDGWRDEMVYKTLCRAAYDDITIDGQKIDDHYVKMLIQDEERYNLPEAETAQTIIDKKQASAKDLAFDEAEDVTNEPEAKKLEPKKETTKVPETKQAEAVENKKLDPVVNGEGSSELNFG